MISNYHLNFKCALSAIPRFITRISNSYVSLQTLHLHETEVRYLYNTAETLLTLRAVLFRGCSVNEGLSFSEIITSAGNAVSCRVYFSIPLRCEDLYISFYHFVAALDPHMPSSRGRKRNDKLHTREAQRRFPEHHAQYIQASCLYRSRDDRTKSS